MRQVARDLLLVVVAEVGAQVQVVAELAISVPAWVHLPYTVQPAGSGA